MNIQDAEAAVTSILTQAYGEEAARRQEGPIRDGMRPAELVRLYAVLREHGVRSAVEIGMACGTSSIVISKAIAENGGGTLVSVDPFQHKSYQGKGLQVLKAVGLNEGHRLIEEPDYLGLPRLVGEGHQCDFVLVDGWHSFDYTFADLFYADLLLKVGGIVMIHDTGMPCVHKACHFFEYHKPYKRLSPPVMKSLDSVIARAVRRVGTLLSGPKAMAEAKARREEWFALGAYQKMASQQVPENHPINF